MDNLENLRNDLNKLINNLGLDIAQCEFDVVWADPHNVKVCLEQTEANRKKLLGDLKNISMRLKDLI